MTKKQTEKLEYRLYYGLVFVAAIPFAVVKAAYRLVVPNPARPNSGIVTRAKEQASIVTPMIFSVR